MHGRTVTLEPLDAERHAADLWRAVLKSDQVWQWLSDGPFASESAFTASIAAKQSAPDAVFYAILTEEVGYPPSPLSTQAVLRQRVALGYASFMRMDPAHGVIEVGNILLAPAMQRTTAATEAMYLMARHVFELGYRRYEWKCNAENLPSRRAAERLGFTFEGIFRQHMVIKERNRDTAWFAMLDNEWPARKAVFEAWLEPGNFDGDGRQRHPLRMGH